ncbi:immunoglobulin-binding protein 1 isoform X3 [Pantherophis guttatus]|uniref:immunoglobulin-binding protein 1 isoform X3 n=1 Tax=Pantherophis guttatus TaxID=94885 RepID=UPI00295B77AC|nr:immunoglobulin-binding protein 1 isoform X3 [Pantherophis guttatus]
MAAAAEGEEGPRLSELLESGWRLLEEVESDTEGSSGAPAVQRRVQRGLELLERAARAVSQLELFSRNEELEEIASADLRFMLVPALLAALTLRQVAPPRRLEHLRRARGLFLDFLRLCRNYAVARFDLPREAVDSDDEEHGGEAAPAPAPSDGQASLLAMAAARRAKIERYKQKKELENQLASLKPFVDSGQAEEEQIREFYLLQIKKWVTVSLEEIESIDQEIAILNRRGAVQCEQMLKIAPPPVFPSLLPGSIHTTFPATPIFSEALHPYSGCCPGKVYHWGKGGSFCCFWQGGGLDGRRAVHEGRVGSSCSCCSA